MLANRHLAHPLQDHQLDFGDVREADIGSVCCHGIGTRSMTSWMTASVVRPWLAACGPSQTRWGSTYGASSWMSSGYTSVRPRSRRAHTFASRPQQMMARGDASRSTPFSTSSEGECVCQSVSG